jgi:hypothetical protein
VPRVDDRRVLNGICWVLRSRAPWRDLPDCYGPCTTCYNGQMRGRGREARQAFPRCAFHRRAPELSPSDLHCAMVADGPGGRWEGGEYRLIEAKNKALMKAAEQAEIEANGCFTDPPAAPNGPSVRPQPAVTRC